MSVPFNTEFLLPLLKPKGFSCPFLFTSQLGSSARARAGAHRAARASSSINQQCSPGSHVRSQKSPQSTFALYKDLGSPWTARMPCFCRLSGDIQTQQVMGRAVCPRVSVGHSAGCWALLRHKKEHPLSESASLRYSLLMHMKQQYGLCPLYFSRRFHCLDILAPQPVGLEQRACSDVSAERFSP